MHLAEAFGATPDPWWSGDRLRDWLSWLIVGWAIAALVLLARQAWSYPEPKGRQQAALLAAGLLPWTILAILQQTPLLDRSWRDALAGRGLEPPAAALPHLRHRHPGARGAEPGAQTLLDAAA